MWYVLLHWLWPNPAMFIMLPNHRKEWSMTTFFRSHEIIEMCLFSYITLMRQLAYYLIQNLLHTLCPCPEYVSSHEAMRHTSSVQQLFSCGELDEELTFYIYNENESAKVYPLQSQLTTKKIFQPAILKERIYSTLYFISPMNFVTYTAAVIQLRVVTE